MSIVTENTTTQAKNHLGGNEKAPFPVEDEVGKENHDAESHGQHVTVSETISSSFHSVSNLSSSQTARQQAEKKLLTPLEESYLRIKKEQDRLFNKRLPKLKPLFQTFDFLTGDQQRGLVYDFKKLVLFKIVENVNMVAAFERDFKDQTENSQDFNGKVSDLKWGLDEIMVELRTSSGQPGVNAALKTAIHSNLEKITASSLAPNLKPIEVTDLDFSLTYVKPSSTQENFLQILQDQIEVNFDQLQAKESQVREIIQAGQRVQSCIEQCQGLVEDLKPGSWSLVFIRSSANGNLTKDTDWISMSLMVDTKEPYKLLKELRYALKTKFSNFLDKVYYIDGPRQNNSVQFVDKISKLHMSVFCNEILGLMTSTLLQRYSQIDQRVHRLVFALITWREKYLKQSPLMKKPISLYDLQLMLICFMQREKLLPLIQVKQADANIQFENTYLESYDQLLKSRKPIKVMKTNVGVMSLEQAQAAADKLASTQKSVRNEADIFKSFLEFLLEKQPREIFNLPRGKVEYIPPAILKRFLMLYMPNKSSDLAPTEKFVPPQGKSMRSFNCHNEAAPFRQNSFAVIDPFFRSFTPFFTSQKDIEKFESLTAQLDATLKRVKAGERLLN